MPLLRFSKSRWANLVDRAVRSFARYENESIDVMKKDRLLEFTTLLLDSIGDHPSAEELIARLPDVIARHIRGITMMFKEIIFQHRIKCSMWNCGKNVAKQDIATWHHQLVRAMQMANRVRLRDLLDDAECVCLVRPASCVTSCCPCTRVTLVMFIRPASSRFGWTTASQGRKGPRSNLWLSAVVMSTTIHVSTISSTKRSGLISLVTIVVVVVTAAHRLSPLAIYHRLSR